jgi:hypothetical protein
MKNYKLLALSLLFYSLGGSASAQISLEPKKPINAVCPRIEPMGLDEMDSKYEKTANLVLKHYFFPVAEVFSGPVNVASGILANAGIYATYLFNPAGVASQTLVDIYDSHILVAKKDIFLTYLVMSIQQTYAGQSTFDGLTTKVALDILGRKEGAEVASVLGKTIACVAPSPENPSKFEVAFYGLRKTDCERLQRRFNTATLATAVYVNNSVGGICQSDFGGESLKQLRLFSYYGRNQVTYVFPKQ